MGLKIIKSGYYHPKNPVGNQYFEEHMETTEEWIVQRTGIQSRFWEKDVDVSDMAINAVEQLNLSREEKDRVKVVIVASLSQDFFMPSLASLLQKEFSLRKDVFSTDMNMACSGFVGASIVAHGLLEKGQLAIIVGAEKLSKLINQQDRSTAMLFGDGAGAVLFEKTEEEFHFVSGTVGSFDLKLVREEDLISMDGKSVYKFAVDTVPKEIARLLEQGNTKIEAVDHLVLHQANIRIIKAVAKRTGGLEKYYTNLDRHGNTSSASIPICLGEMEETKLLQSGDKILMFGFGGGFTYAGALVDV